jgi:hypothetical protein
VTESSPVTLRPAVEREWRLLRRLAELDSASALAGSVLVAEVDGEVLAALSVEEGRAIANPFRRTAELVALLRVRAAQLADQIEAPQRGGRSLRIRRRWPPAVEPSPRPGRAAA